VNDENTDAGKLKFGKCFYYPVLLALAFSIITTSLGKLTRHDAEEEASKKNKQREHY
jgi:hypothetical protein